MNDRASENLRQIVEGGEYAVEHDVPIFDEHDEFDNAGNLIRRFDKAKLQRIAEKANQREQKTGDLAVVAFGHTDDRRGEEDQPAPQGYGRNYRVVPFGNEGKSALICDLYIKKRIKTADGQMVNGPEYAKTFPRRSIEIWPKDLTLDWIALLRRTPERDLGLLAYAREKHRKYFDPDHKTCAVMTGHGKLRYSMESAMGNEVDPTMPADPNADASTTTGAAPEGPPEGHEDFAKHLHYAMKNCPVMKGMVSKYAADESDGEDPDTAMERYSASLSATNTAVPPAVEPKPTEDDEALARMSRATRDVRRTREQAQLDAQAKEIENLKRDKQMERFSRVIDGLEREGFEFTREEELQRFQKAGFSNEWLADRETTIRKYHRQSPDRLDLPNGAIPEAKAKGSPLEDRYDDIVRYMKERGMSGPTAYRQAARDLKIIE